MVCRDFILPEICKPCLFFSSFQFAKLIVPHPLKYTITDKIRFNLKEIEKLKSSFFGSRILPEVETSIRYRASVESIHSSTSIEGNPLNINEVRALVSSDKILSKEEYAEIEVQNYKNALDYISKRRHIETSLSIADILELHRIITDRLLDKTRNGKLRQNPVYIENQDGEIVYEGAFQNSCVDEHKPGRSQGL